MTDNLTIWKKHADIDPKFTKPITGRDYRGTSPNPHYIIQCLTELFGPVGRGFGWSVLNEDFQPLGDGVLLHWCRIRFWWKDAEGTHEYEAYGQTKAAYLAGGRDGKEKYLRTDEDAPKKSLTDAITKAASQIGIASSIFLGRWDDDRYVLGITAQYEMEDAMARDTAFWDRIYDQLPEEPEPISIAELAASDIRTKAESYKMVKSIDQYVQRIKKSRLDFIERNAPDAHAELMDSIRAHRQSLQEAK